METCSTARRVASFAEWLREHRGELDAVVLDVDGVLVLRGEALPGAHQLVALLRALELPFGLLTNDNGQTAERKLEQLARCGLAFEPEEIYSPGSALVAMAAGRGLAGKPYFVFGEGDYHYAVQAGLRAERDPRRLSACRGVILGERGYSWQEALNRTVNFFLRHPAAELIVPNPDTFFPRPDGRVRVGPGGVAAAVVMLLRRLGVTVKPLYLGKPHAPIFRYHHRHLESRLGRRLARDRVMMAGDSLTGDVAGANRFGYRSVLVMTGLSTAAMLERSAVQPELAAEGL